MIGRKILITGDFDLPGGISTTDVVHLRIPKDNQDIIAALSGVTHYVVGGPEYVDASLLNAAPDLKHIVVMGTGINSFVNMPEAAARHIAVDNTPGLNADVVAEFALGAVISNLANVYHSRDDLLDGGWMQKPHKSLADAEIGIIGLGDIGSSLARKLRSISKAPISYFSRTRKPELEAAIQLRFKPLSDLLPAVDALIVSITYTPETHHMLNRQTLSMAKDGQILLNFSNPKVFDPAALKDALATGKPARAFFDGYYNEWTANQGVASDAHGLLALGASKFIATSHIAAQTEGAIEAIVQAAFRKIESRNALNEPQRGRKNAPNNSGFAPG